MWRSDEFGLFPEYTDANCTSGSSAQQAPESIYKAKLSEIELEFQQLDTSLAYVVN